MSYANVLRVFGIKHVYEIKLIIARNKTCLLYIRKNCENGPYGFLFYVGNVHIFEKS